MEYPKFKVCCRCFTFNQAKYITDAMNGFTMQQTSFPFVCTIVDDASTDGEQEVIRKYVEDNFDLSEDSVAFHEETDYAHITYAQHKTNKNCYFAVLYLKENHYSQRKPKMGYLSEWQNMCEYEAICEGDDYWISAEKLQKQVRVMDDNPKCMLSFHAVNEIYEKNHSLDHVRSVVENREYTGIEWFLKRPAQTASFIIRRSVYSQVFYKEQVVGKFPAGDVPLLLTCAKFGIIIGLSDVMSVYRHNDGGWTSQLRTKEEVWNLAKSHLQFALFGEEYKRGAQFLYQRECIGYFFTCLKHRRMAFEFLVASLKVSLKGTIRCIRLVLQKRYV